MASMIIIILIIIIEIRIIRIITFIYLCETSICTSLINKSWSDICSLSSICLAFLAAEFVSSFASLEAALLAIRTSYFIALTVTFNSTPCHVLMDANLFD